MKRIRFWFFRFLEGNDIGIQCRVGFCSSHEGVRFFFLLLLLFEVVEIHHIGIHELLLLTLAHVTQQISDPYQNANKYQEPFHGPEYT